jgi:hypothetical protein
LLAAIGRRGARTAGAACTISTPHSFFGPTPSYVRGGGHNRRIEMALDETSALFFATKRLTG